MQKSTQKPMLINLTTLLGFTMVVSVTSICSFAAPRSTVLGFDPIANVHEVRGPKIIRGATPENMQAINALRAKKITDFIIFKIDNKGEVTSEIQALQKSGYAPASIVNIPFEWRRPVPFKESCHQLIQALKIMLDVERSTSRKIYFHCTAGQDRTSLLAGLFQVLHGENIQNVFTNEMCARGYEAGGGAGKPANVVNAIRQNLTPIYLKMAALMQTKQITLDHLDAGACLNEPAFQAQIVAQWKCSAPAK